MTTTLAESGISAANRTKPKRLEALIIGAPGSRKTVTAHTLPNTRTLDFDNGMQSVEWAILEGVLKKKLSEVVFETITVPSGSKMLEEKLADMLDHAMDQVDEWIEEEDIDPAKWDKPYPQFWDTLIVDSASFMMDNALGLALTENKRIKLSNSLDGAGAGLSKKRKERGLYVAPMRIQDWGSAGSLFMRAVRHFRGLGKNLIITAHEYTEIDEDTGSVVAIRPNVVGQLRTKLPAAFDEVWYTKVKPHKDNVEVFFRLQPESKREAKSRLGCLGIEHEGNFAEMRKKVAKFYGVDESLLWTAYHGTEGRLQAEREQEEESVAV